MDVYYKKVYDSRTGNHSYSSWTEEYLYLIKDGDKESRFAIRDGIDRVSEISPEDYSDIKIEDMENISGKSWVTDILDKKMPILSTDNKIDIIKSCKLYEFLNPDAFKTSEFVDLVKSLGPNLAQYITVKRDFYPGNQFYNLDVNNLKTFKGLNSNFEIEEFQDINNFKGVTEIPKGISGVGVIFEIEGEDKVFVVNPENIFGISSDRTDFSIESLNEIVSERRNYGRKLQSFAAKAKIPWECAKGFVDGSEVKSEINERIADVNYFKEAILKNYNSYYAKELFCGKVRRNEALKEILGEEFSDKYFIGNLSNKRLEPYDKLVQSILHNYNKDLLTEVSNVDNKENFKKIISNIENYSLLEEESINQILNKAIELNDKDTYKLFFKNISIDSCYSDSLTSSYVNNSALNYIFKENLEIDPFKACELGKTFAVINNSTYNDSEKDILKNCAVKVLDCSEYYIDEKPEGFNNATLKVLNKAIREHRDIDVIEKITDRMVKEERNVFNIYKEEVQKDFLEL